MKKLTVRITLLEEMLGTSPANEELYRDYIASKAPKPEETADSEVAALSVDEREEKSMTIFPKLADGTPFVYDYQIRGFLKEAASTMKKVPDTLSAKLKAHKKQIDNFIHCEPREIPFDLHGMLMSTCERPLRADTAQGPRVALAKSETVPAGSTLEFSVCCLLDSDVEYVKEWLNYGNWKGLGQWRNSGKGRFSVEYLESNGKE